MIRVALIADSPVVRAGLTALLASAPGIEVVDARIALKHDVIPAAGGMAAPDIELVVWAPAHFDGTDGTALLDAGELDASPFAPGLVALLPALDPATVSDAVRGGAWAVLPIDADRDELVAAIHAVA